jgi:hypothetical protein
MKSLLVPVLHPTFKNFRREPGAQRRSDMKFGKACRAGLAAAALMLGSFAAQAAPLTFFGSDAGAGGKFPTDATNPAVAAQAAFEAQVAVTKSEAFTSSSAGSIRGAANSTPIFGGGAGTLTQVDPNTDASNLLGAVIKSGNEAFGRFNTTGGSASGAWIETDWTFTVNIGERVGAFAFFGTDFGDFDGGLAIELFDGANSVATNVFLDNGQPFVTGPGSGSLLFFGYVADVGKLFDRIEFRISQAGGFDTLGFDDLRVGHLRAPPTGTVPEPGSLALAGLALFAAGWARKARAAA